MTNRKPANKPRVLLVDDDPSALASLGWFLESEGYVVGTATDGTEALKVLGETAPSVIVSDLRMPNVDGMQW